MDHVLSRSRGIAVALISAALLIPLLSSSPAIAGSGGWKPGDPHPNIARWWQFEPVTWRYGWWHDPRLKADNDRFQRNHPHASKAREDRVHLWFRHLWRAEHFHKAIGAESGDATWYDQTGTIGACGVRLEGMYAASRTLPCGSLVSVRHGSKYVFVTIEDRGPYGSAQRILDLAPGAFSQLAPLSTGVISIGATVLRRH